MGIDLIQEPRGKSQTCRLAGFGQTAIQLALIDTRAPMLKSQEPLGCISDGDAADPTRCSGIEVTQTP
jgi:hypothetical protein